MNKLCVHCWLPNRDTTRITPTDRGDVEEVAAEGLLELSSSSAPLFRLIIVTSCCCTGKLFDTSTIPSESCVMFCKQWLTWTPSVSSSNICSRRHRTTRKARAATTRMEWTSTTTARRTMKRQLHFDSIHSQGTEGLPNIGVTTLNCRDGVWESLVRNWCDFGFGPSGKSRRNTNYPFPILPSTVCKALRERGVFVSLVCSDLPVLPRTTTECHLVVCAFW